MINYHKNEMINECLQTYYATFARTLDTADFVPPAYNKRILRYIFKKMRKAFKRIDKEDKLYQREFAKRDKMSPKCGSDVADRSEVIPEIVPKADEGQRSESDNVAIVQRNEPGLENPEEKEEKHDEH